MNFLKIKKFFNKKFSISKLEEVDKTIRSFSLSLTERIILGFLFIILILSTLAMLYKINEDFLIKVPAKGGKLIEGSIGSPRFINPLLSLSNADRDLTTLIYSGLMKATSQGGLIPELAESYEISKDGLTYTFKLKDDIYFHDGEPVTAEDVEFTIRASQDNTIKSFKRANWDSIRIEVINKKEIKFILKTPYSPFLENTILGILPKHIWGAIPPEQFAFSEFNIEPIGSGPYKIKNIKKNSSGVLEQYELVAFKKYVLGEPFITKIVINFYANEEALINAYKKGAVEAINSISPENTKLLEKSNGMKIESVPLPRIFGIFFNQNQNPVFANKEVREALNKSIDKNRIVSEILSGYGIAINNPVPPVSKFFDTSSQEEVFDPQKASDLLEKNGWKIDKNGVRSKKINKKITTLNFSISTSDSPELKAAAEIIKENWEKIGASVAIKVFESGDLNQNVIRQRNYDTLLFGEIIGRDMDLFAFWHSSQRNDPGLNIAMYANVKTDKLLEEARSTYDDALRDKKYKAFQAEILKDVPAIFIYSPNFIYIIPNKINSLSLGQITTPSERFLNVNTWNIETETLWKIFGN